MIGKFRVTTKPYMMELTYPPVDPEDPPRISDLNPVCSILEYEIGPSVERAPSTVLTYPFHTHGKGYSFTIYSDPIASATPTAAVNTPPGNSYYFDPVYQSDRDSVSMIIDISLEKPLRIYNPNPTAFTNVQFKSTTSICNKLICLNGEVFINSPQGTKIAEMDSQDWEINIKCGDIHKSNSFIVPLVIRYPGGCMVMTYLNYDSYPGTVYTFYSMQEDDSQFIPICITDSPVSYDDYGHVGFDISGENPLFLSFKKESISMLGYDTFEMFGKKWAHILKKKDTSRMVPLTPSEGIGGFSMKGVIAEDSLQQIEQRLDQLEENIESTKTSFVVI